MPSPISLERPPTAVGFVPIFLVNLIPLVGVVRLGWDPATLVVIYTLEVLFSFPLAGTKALFAQRPPRTDRDGATVISVSNELTQKRGSVELFPWLPPIYPRTVPFAVAVVGAAAWFGIIVGIFLAEVFPVADVLARPEVAVSVVALVAGQSIETWRGYLRDGRYETATPYTMIETPTRQAFFLAFVLFAVPGTGSVGAEIALGGFVLVKLLVEWSAYRATQGGGRLIRWLSGPEEAVKDADSVCIPEGEPDARVPTDGLAVLYTGVFHTLARLAPFYASGSLIVWLVSLVILGGEASRAVAIGSGLVVFGLFVVLLAVRVATVYLRYGPLEYRRYGDRLVAYDAFLDEPQWSASVEVLRDVEVVPNRLPDRLLGTRTIAVTTGWNDDESRRYLGPVADADALVEVLDLPVVTTELEPLDRRLAAGAIACVVVIVVAAILIAVGPWMSSTALLYGVFVFPFIAVVLRTLWAQAYPDPSE